MISLGGDWFLFVALGGLVVEATGKALAVGVLILSQELPIFLATPWAGWLADRLDRRRLMVACDVARAAICCAFLLVGPDNLWLAFLLLAVLSVFAAVFDPASSASIPNVVDPEDLPVANALSGSIWGTMLAVGAALGGVIATVFGRDTAFLVDAVSFAVSAFFLMRIHRSFSEVRTASRRIHDGHRRDMEWWNPSTFGGKRHHVGLLHLDPKRELVYVGTGNGTPNRPAVPRPGGRDDLYVFGRRTRCKSS